ncbi:unnamed protein product [Malus baccata var. baccata]
MEADSSSFKIILGSASIARRKILAEMGYEFTVVTADIDEKSIRTEKPEELVLVLAKAKADAIISKLQSINNQEKDAEPTIVIAADTVVVYEGVIREKPSSKEEARQFLKGHAATVGSVHVTNLKTGFSKGEWDRVEIYFHKIPDEVIEKLVRVVLYPIWLFHFFLDERTTIEPIPLCPCQIEEGIVLKVAGGLIIEHPLILPYVKEVVGTTDSVMGLPIDLTSRLLKEAL